MKKKTTLRDCTTVMAFGLAGAVIYHVLIGIGALLIGFMLAAVLDIAWYIPSLISYFAIRFVIEGLNAFSGLRATRCPECKRKIKTSNPIKCEECGGAAQLVRRQH